MRVVAGRFGGRRLRSLTHTGLRPTSERVREALFAILGQQVTGARTLDLFAGTGGLGIAALSRGAAVAVFVERDRRAVSLLRANLALLGLGPGEAELVIGPVASALRNLAGQGRQFDLVLADPPYEAGVAGLTLSALAGGHLVAADGLVVLEHRASVSFIVPAGLILADRRAYGDTVLSFLEQAGDPPEEEPMNGE